MTIKYDQKNKIRKYNQQIWPQKYDQKSMTKNVGPQNMTTNSDVSHHMFIDEMYIKEEHSFPMVAGLTPVLNLATVESLLLGAPFSGIN